MRRLERQTEVMQEQVRSRIVYMECQVLTRVSAAARPTDNWAKESGARAEPRPQAIQAAAATPNFSTDERGLCAELRITPGKDKADGKAYRFE